LLPLIVFGFFGFIPAMSLHELLTTGTIDWTAVGSGRRKVPIWIIYAFGWVGFLWFVSIFVPMLKYYVRPVMFALEHGAIEVEGQRIANQDVIAIRPRQWHVDALLETTHGNHRLHLHLVPKGVTALRSSFPDRFRPGWLKDGNEWFVGR
jgi:hypothetical protein